MKLNFYQKQNQLDEMQEQTLRKIESRSFWLLWWGLLALIAFRQVRGASPDAVLGEFLIFLVGSVYMVGSVHPPRHLGPAYPAHPRRQPGGGADRWRRRGGADFSSKQLLAGSFDSRRVLWLVGLFYPPSDGGNVQKTPSAAGKYRGGKP